MAVRLSEVRESAEEVRLGQKSAEGIVFRGERKKKESEEGLNFLTKGATNR